MARHRILSVEYDRALLCTRNALLWSAGYHVVGRSSFDQATQSLSTSGFELIVIGCTVPPEERSALIQLAKERMMSPPVLVLCNEGEPPVPGADATVALQGLGGAFLSSVEGLLRSSPAVRATA
ncbi:MAG TPA: hypothetical protein VEG30_10045 [Terriglobales bacterium]|nr:hypothetical protein [Terriglobales bacterium]